MKHFKLTSEFALNSLGVKLFRIEATIDSKYAKIGEKGGFIEGITEKKYGSMKNALEEEIQKRVHSCLRCEAI